MASAPGKTVSCCVSGFHDGRSVIIFNPVKMGLCCVSSDRPRTEKPERNVKCHLNLSGSGPLNGSTVAQMPGFGSDWVCRHSGRLSWITAAASDSSLQIFSLFVRMETTAPSRASALFSCTSCLFYNSMITQNVRNLLCTTQDKASIMEDGVNLACGHIWTHSDS